MQSELAAAFGERDRSMPDGHPGGSCRVDDPPGVVQHVGLVHHLFHRAVQRAAFGSEII